MSAETVGVPNCWAGGAHVTVPGLGVGRIVLDDPRVIEIPLPAPECAVFLVDGTRAVVLTDPRTPYERTLRAIAMSRTSAFITSADGPVTGWMVGHRTQVANLPVIMRPGLRLSLGTGQTVSRNLASCKMRQNDQ